LLDDKMEMIADTNSLSAGLYETKMFIEREVAVGYRATFDGLPVAGEWPRTVG